MRISFTSALHQWDPRHGGGQKSVHELATALVKRGHDVEVVCTSDRRRPPPPVRTDYRLSLAPHHERLYLNPMEVARAFRHRRDLDIVHSQGYEGAFLRAVLPRSTRLVATSRHPDPKDLTPRAERRSLVGNLAWHRRMIIPLLERRSLSSADLVVCVSAHSAATLKERGYLSEGTRIEVIHNGASATGAGPPPGADIEFVCVARLDYHKGIDVLLRGLSLLDEPRPRLDILGLGPQETALRQLVSNLGLDAVVRFRGLAQDADVRAFMAAAIALILPSRAENFPRVILEALHMGTAIIATHVGGVPEAVRHEHEALLVPPEDSGALARAMKRVLDDPTTREYLARRGRERSRHFTWDRAAELTEAAYQTLHGGPLDASQHP